MCLAEFGVKRKRRQRYFFATEQAQRGVLITLIADVAQSYFILRELDLELEISRRTLRVNDETVEFYRRRLFGGVSNQLEFDQAIGQSLAHGGQHSGSGTPDRDARKPHQLSARAQSRIHSSWRGFDRSVPSAKHSRRFARGVCSSAGPTSKRRRICCSPPMPISAPPKRFSFPNFSLTAALGSVSHDLSNIADKRAAIWSISGGVLQPIFQGWRIFCNYEGDQSAL